MRHPLFFKKAMFSVLSCLSNGFLIFPEHATQLARLPFLLMTHLLFSFPLAVVYSCAKLESEEVLKGARRVCACAAAPHYFCLFNFFYYENL